MLTLSGDLGTMNFTVRSYKGMTKGNSWKTR